MPRRQNYPNLLQMGTSLVFVNPIHKIAAGIFLIEAKLCQVYTCFKYPSVKKLHKLLSRAGHNTERKIIEMINKFYHYYQIKIEAPQRFKFTLKKDINFKYEIIVNVMYLNKKPVLHIVDAAIAF